MKIITIPDLHGKEVWDTIDPTAYDKIIFLGDYVDSKGDYSGREEATNLERIIEFKKQHFQEVELLIGNHDLHYMYFPLYRASAFNVRMQPVFTELFKNNKGCFSFAFQMGSHLWTHAGVSKHWHTLQLPIIESLSIADPLKELGLILNKMETNHLNELAAISPIRGGLEAHGGIMWADKLETIHDYLPGLHQYVGHTKVPSITMVGDATSSIYYLDCLNSEEKFFVQELADSE